MKINKAKLLVGTLAIASVAATVGSISGTIAWFQYNTRVTAAYMGTTASCSELLHIRIHDENVVGYEDAKAAWRTDLRIADINAYLTAKQIGSKIAPVTYPEAFPASNGALDNSKFKSNPLPQDFAYAKWNAASGDNFVVLPLEVKLLDGNDSVLADKEVYLSELVLEQHTSNSGKEDISNSLRVHLHTEYTATSGGTATLNNSFWGKNSNDTTAKVTDTLGGYLDLDSDGKYDKTGKWEWEASHVTTEYGNSALSHEAYNVSASKNTDENPMVSYNNNSLDTTKSVALGKTGYDGILSIKTTIWLEGWAGLNDAASFISDQKSATEIEAITDAELGDTYKAKDTGDVYRYMGSGSGQGWQVVDLGAVWDGAEYVGSDFHVGLEFSVNPL